MNSIKFASTLPLNERVELIRMNVTLVLQSTEEEIDGLQPEQSDKCTSKEIPYNTVLSSYDIVDLNPNTLYKVHLAARNGIGIGKRSERFYKTNGKYTLKAETFLFFNYINM